MCFGNVARVDMLADDSHLPVWVPDYSKMDSRTGDPVPIWQVG